ncbi:MAG: hypothetical protein Q4F55_02610 [Bacillota bacterium]|nr:hypothetical protein [Bacillota bacterium]
MSEIITLENYEEKRRELVDLNSNLQGVILNEKEQAVDKYLEKLKKAYVDSCNGNVPYDMPTLSDKNIQESDLYEFCDKLPKGADLHVHDMALLPAHELVELLLTCPEMYINSDRKTYDLCIADSNNPVKEGYISFASAINSGYYTKEDIIYHWTTESAKDSEKNIWDFFEYLFNCHAVLSDNNSFAKKYYDYTFRYYCKHGIMHVEIHNMLTMGLDESYEYVKVIRQAYYDVKKDYPYFTARIIGAGVKADNENIDFTKQCFVNASYAQELVKDESDPANLQNFVIGFDLVNEEDTSLPLKAFAPMLLKVKKLYPDMKLYIHGGESLNASNENLIDAYLLGVSRVGHGLNLYRFPDLHARYAKAEICLEVCPISNERLQYTTDLRNHQATEYLRTGIVMALCSDDPSYMEYNTLTDDFFAATVCWGLSLADMKQFGINSIMYSGLDETTKRNSLRSYNALWKEFINQYYEKI